MRPESALSAPVMTTPRWVETRRERKCQDDPSRATLVDDWNWQGGSLKVFSDGPDGKIVMAYNAPGYNNVFHPNLARVNPDGSIDTSFTTYINTVMGPPKPARAARPHGAIRAAARSAFGRRRTPATRTLMPSFGSSRQASPTAPATRALVPACFGPSTPSASPSERSGRA